LGWDDQSDIGFAIAQGMLLWKTILEGNRHWCNGIPMMYWTIRMMDALTVAMTRLHRIEI